MHRLKAEKLIRLYRRDPCLYAEQVLGVVWWSKQREIVQALLKHKRVFVKASHSVGKSFLAASLVNWFFDCFVPGLCITTAPNAQQVKDILWKEVRIQRPEDLREALQPKAPRMESSPDHFAMGYTARNDAGFQGRHEQYVFIVFDECVGVESTFWDAAEGMMTGQWARWLVICNPTDTASRAYQECLDSEKWHVIEISAMDHPNIGAELAGLPPPFPKAVDLEWVYGRLKEWAEPVTPGDERASDVEFPPKSGKWFRPGPLFESRVLGRWPSQGGSAVWSDATWLAALVPQEIDPAAQIEIGCDVARFGDDFTEIMVRRGNCAIHHERHNGWSTTHTAAQLKRLALLHSPNRDQAQKVPVKVDDGGVGGGVVDQAEGYSFVAVNSASTATEEDGYPNKRSELWFNTAIRAAEGRVDLSRLSVESRALIRKQVMSPTWKLDAQGRRVVEPKADTKRRIGGSPDSADAMNLVYYGGADWAAAVAATEQSAQRVNTAPKVW